MNGNRTFLEVDSMVVTWWIVGFLFCFLPSVQFKALFTTTDPYVSGRVKNTGFLGLIQVRVGHPPRTSVTDHVYKSQVILLV